MDPCSLRSGDRGEDHGQAQPNEALRPVAESASCSIRVLDETYNRDLPSAVLKQTFGQRPISSRFYISQNVDCPATEEEWPPLLPACIVVAYAAEDALQHF